MRVSRTIPAVALASLIGAVLTGCGGDNKEQADAAAATTLACRSYVLVGGADADQLSDQLQAVLDGNGSYNVEDVTRRVLPIRNAAVKAGLTEGLPKKDYRLFAALVDATLAAELAVSGHSDDASTLAPAIGAYNRAVRAVDARCR